MKFRIRKSVMALILAGLFAGTFAFAADGPATQPVATSPPAPIIVYFTTHTASNGEILIKSLVLRPKNDHEPAAVLSRPYVLIKDGATAGAEPGKPPQQNQPDGKSASLPDHSIKLEFIKPMGSSDVLAVVTWMEGGTVTFSKAMNIPVDGKTYSTTQPAGVSSPGALR